MIRVRNNAGEIIIGGPYVEDLECPKCGHDNVEIRWCNEDGLFCKYTADPEHFHRTCYRCDYCWITNDVLNLDPSPLSDTGAI